MTSIAITPANPSIGAGSQQQFTAMGVFSDGSMSAISGEVAWSSSDTTLAGVTGSGLALVLGIGRPQITATSGSFNASTRLIITAGTSMPAARFAYAANSVDNSMSAYVIDPATGQLRSNGYVMTGKNPVNTTVEPHGKFAYVLNADDSTLSVFSIEASTGALSPVPSSPLPTQAGSMVFDPSGAFVYVLNTNNDSSMSISAFSLDANTGGLTPIGGSPVTAVSFFLTVDPSGKFLYSGATPLAIDPATGAITPTSAQNPPTNLQTLAIAPGSKFAFGTLGACSSAIRAFTIDPANGTLREVLGSPFFASMGFPDGIAFDSSGQFLYSANFGICSPHPAAGTASSFSISASGALTEISSIVVPFGPSGIQVGPGNKFGYIVTDSNEIEIISISTTGHLSLVGAARTREGFNTLSLSLGAKPVTYTPQWLYTANSGSNDVSMYSIDGTSGALTSKGTTPAGTLPRGISVTPSQKFAYVANQSSNNVFMYTIDAATGALAAIGTIAAGTGPGSITVESSGRFAYVGNLSSNDVSMFTINSSTGVLTANGTIAAGTTPNALAVDPTGRFLYVANQGSKNMSIFRIDGTTGTSVDEGPLSPGSFPGPVTFHPSGRFFYLINQLNQISMYALVETNGVDNFQSPEIVSIGTLTAGTQIPSLTVDPIGRFAFAGDVASNAVLEFTIDLVGGVLSPAGSIASGMFPGSTVVEPSGRFVYAANQNSNNVSMYAIDPSSGTLTSIGNVAAGTQPVSLVTTGTLQ